MAFPEARAVPLFILHWNQPSECLRTVEAFRAQSTELKIVVLDNASDVAKLAVLRSGLSDDVEIVRLEQNYGWGPAFNIVLREWLSTGDDEFCFISAHDALPAPDCLALLMRGAEADERLGIICPQYARAEIPRFSRLRYIRLAPAKELAAGTAEIIDVPNGTLMLFRRACLREIGLFDERYFAYGDEHELGLRAVRLNWKVGMIWGAVVINPGTWTASFVRSYLTARNSLLTTRSYAGYGWALLRLLLTIPNTLRLMIFPPPESYAFSAKARLAAIRDFLLERYGPPPAG